SSPDGYSPHKGVSFEVSSDSGIGRNTQASIDCHLRRNFFMRRQMERAMAANRTCRLLTLGCKVNQYETQYVKEMLEANGYREALPDEPAELCVVNTCTVTHEADAKGRQLIRRLAEANPGASLVVMGCYATREPETVARLPGVVKVITDKARLAEELRPFGIV